MGFKISIKRGISDLLHPEFLAEGSLDEVIEQSPLLGEETPRGGFCGDLGNQPNEFALYLIMGPLNQ